MSVVVAQVMEIFMGPLRIFCLLAISCLAFPASGQDTSLSISNIKHFQVAIEQGLAGVWRRDKQIFTFAKKADFYILSQYEPEPKEVDLAFGSLHNPLDLSERVALASGEKPRFLRGMVALDAYLLFLDSGLRQLLVWNEQEKIWHQPADIVLDLVRPPPDSRGEAPMSETKRLRQKLSEGYKAFGGKPDLMVGISPLPDSWRKNDKSQFLILLRLPAAPLLTVHCEGKHFRRCMAQRACYVSGLSDEEIRNASGLALHPSRGELWVGLPDKMQIKRLQAKTCLNVKAAGSLAIDKSLPGISNLSIDQELNLWITLSEPDREKSSSLFRWDAAFIKKMIQP